MDRRRGEREKRQAMDGIVSAVDSSGATMSEDCCQEPQAGRTSAETVLANVTERIIATPAAMAKAATTILILL